MEKPERETFESSLRIGRETLELLGLDAYEAREKADTFRRYNLKMLEDTLENYQDTEFRIASLQRAKEMLSAPSSRIRIGWRGCSRPAGAAVSTARRRRMKWWKPKDKSRGARSAPFLLSSVRP